MLRYYTVAFALKLFSLSPQTRRLYRLLGNTIGARKRAKTGLRAVYIERARQFWNLAQKYDFIKQDAHLLELGTGWVHWDATILRLFYDAKFTLFDVWDNRQFQPYQAYLSEFREVLENELEDIPTPRRKHAQDLLSAITSASSFDEVYELLGFEYVVEPTGTLQNLADDSFDACFSFNVFEHIDAEILPEYIKDLYRLLKPGGYSFHNIDVSDHLSHYDPNACRKNYLRYSDTVWRLCFENTVQYFNRVQRSEWLDLFRQAGFELVREESQFQPVRHPVHAQYAHLDQKDIECRSIQIVHRKPPQ